MTVTVSVLSIENEDKHVLRPAGLEVLSSIGSMQEALYGATVKNIPFENDDEDYDMLESIKEISEETGNC